MNGGLDRIVPRPKVRLRMLARHGWGPDRNRLVGVEAVDGDQGAVVNVWGAEGQQLTLLEELSVTRIARTRTGANLTLADGTKLTVDSVPDCGCGSPLKRFRA